MLTGASFTLTYKFSDNSEVNCSAQMSGDNDLGTLNTSSCVASGGSMATSTGASTFETGGAGSYSNNGTTLTLCKNNNSCLSYQ